MFTPASILLISPYPEDHITLKMILPENEWRLRHALSWSEAEPLLKRGPYIAVITESNVDDCCWRDVLKRVGRVPVIVTSSIADENLWAEVLNLGGYNVLAKPFDKKEVQWVARNLSVQKSKPARERRRNPLVASASA